MVFRLLPDGHGFLFARTPQEAAECTSVLRPAWQVAPRICVPQLTLIELD